MYVSISLSPSLQVYGTPVSKGLFSKQRVLALATASITDLPDDTHHKYSFEILHGLKSFRVDASSHADKCDWISKLSKYIERVCVVVVCITSSDATYSYPWLLVGWR